MQTVYNYSGNISFTGTLTSNFCGRNAYNYLVNGYINLDQYGNYTKHYYADAMRVASKIGSGFRDSICSNGDSLQSTALYNVMLKELTELTGDTVDYIDYPFEQITHLQGDSGNYEDGLFFFHGNHLNSTDLITDITGSISQAVLYTPHGQIISEYRADWELDTIIPKFRFNAKEYDEESSLYYFVARYYDPSMTIFTSPDPLFEQKPWISKYCAFLNNPLKYIDPDGREAIEADPPPSNKQPQDKPRVEIKINERVHEADNTKLQTSQPPPTLQGNSDNSSDWLGIHWTSELGSPNQKAAGRETTASVPSEDITPMGNPWYSIFKSIKDFFSGGKENKTNTPKSEPTTPTPEIKSPERTQRNYIEFNVTDKYGDYWGGTQSHNGTKKDSMRVVEGFKASDKTNKTKTTWR